MKLFSINQLFIRSILFLKTPAGLVMLVYGNGLVELFGVAAHFAEMFVSRVGSFSDMVAGKQEVDMRLVGLAFGVGLLFSLIMYVSILAFKLYEMKVLANWFSFLFGLIAFLTYSKFFMGLNLLNGIIYGVSALLIVLVSGISGNKFAGLLAEKVNASESFKTFQSDIVSSFGQKTDTKNRLGRRVR